jgi:hypothetical protein
VSRILHLFADTNLFIQCRALTELDWSEWASFDEVHVIVSRPVQREIDYRKNKGSDRVGDRSRVTNRMFREIIQSDKDHIVVRDAGPCVKLYIRPEYNHDPDLAERLDYSERDDQIIGTISTFKKQNPEADVRLLTDDGTPMATAKSLQIAVAQIPEAWLLPPETTEAEKKLNTVQAELARLKKAEPQFRIGCLDAAGKPVERLEYTLERFEALTEAQLSGLMTRIAERFPMATEFGRREAGEWQQPSPSGTLASLLAFKQVFVPATDEEIAAYHAKHPQWLKSCADILRDYHLTLNHQSGPLAFCFVAVNDGVRPGKDALITIEAKGDFLIMPPPYKASEDEDEEDADAENPARSIELPRPPTPPRGTWRNEHMTAFDALHRTLGDFGSVGRGLHDIGLLERSLMSPHIRPLRRDPNAFFYKPERPMQPAPSFNLECEQWRHGNEEQGFPGEIYFARDEINIAGALECEIHAENLSASALLRVPVRITVTQVSVSERAELLVQGLTGSPPVQRQQAS